MSLISSVQSLTPGSLVHLYEIEAPGTTLRFSPYNHSDGTAVKLYDYTNNSQLNTYYTLPIIASGFQQQTGGPIARPTLTISLAADVQNSNSQTSFRLASSSDFESLLGYKITRRTTLKNYLYEETDDPGSGNTPVEFARQIWVLDRVKEFNKVSITYELCSPFDLEGVFLPKRQIVGNACPWKYQGASSDYNENEKVGGCTWHREGSLTVSYYVTQKVFVNQDDEYIVANTGITAYSSYASGDSISENTYVSTTSTATRINEDGSLTSGQTVTDYWVVKETDTKANLGTPSDSNDKFLRVRVFDVQGSYSASTTYYAYTDDSYNPYFQYTDSNSKLVMWKLTKTATGVAPGFNENWKRGDICGKRLNSCNMRFNAKFADPSSVLSKVSHTPGTARVLPFGGFPGSQRYA